MKNGIKVSKAIVTIMRVLFIFLLASCGGGGGGDDGGGGGGDTLGTYDFNLSILDGHPIVLTSSSETTITIEPIINGDTEENIPILGSYDLDADAITLNNNPMVKVTTNLWEGPSGIISINLDTNLVSVDGEHPTEGSVSLTVGDPLDPDYSVTFTIETTENVTEVTIDNNTTVDSVTYPWEEFEELFWTDVADEDEWQRQASFAYYIMNFFFYEVRFVGDAIMLIEENDTVLPTESVTINGDTFPGTPPAGVASQGTLVLECTDGDAGPGSDFSEVATDYWVDDSGDDIDKLYEGTINFVGFLENVDEERDVITSIGFVPNSEIDPGGVFFDDEGLTIWDTEEISDGVFSATEWINIKGRYSILFYEQD
jgi:hypothetical protein